MRNFKKLLFVLLMFFAFAFVSACGKKDDKPDDKPVVTEKVELADTEVALKVGEEKELSVTVEPEDAKLVWSSSAEAVATVSNGKVVAVAKGEAIITVSIEGKEVKDTVKVVVTEEVKPEEVTVAVSGPKSVRLNKTGQYVATVTPAGKTVAWSVSDDTVAKIDQNGLLTPVKIGKVNVIATVEGVKAEYEVEIKERAKEDPTDITLVINGVEYENGANIQITEFDEFVLEFKYTPAENVNEGVDCSSSNDDVLTVDGDCKVFAVAPGMAYVEVAALSADIVKTYYFTVVEKHFVPESITVTAAYSPVEVNEEVKLTAVVAPERASQEVTWKSSDEAIAVVDENGVVTGKGIGKATISAVSTEIDSVVGTYEVEVIAEVPVDRTVVYVGPTYTERGTKVTIEGKEYIVGKNAYASLTDAAKGAAEGAEIRIEAGTYDQAVSIKKGVKFVALGEVVISQPVTLENGLSGLEFHGITFNGTASILSAKGTGENGISEELYENVVVKNCNFDQVGSSDDATFHIYGLAKNFTFENNTFYFVSYRGVRFENMIENLTFVNNNVTGKAGVLFDALRGMSVVCGDVVVSNNTFDTCAQTMVQFANMSGKSYYTFEKNIFTNVACAAIDIRTYSGDFAEADVKYVIRFNQFLDSVNSWGTIRLRAIGLTAEQVSAEVNYNKFKGIELTDDPNHATLCTWYVQNAGGAVDFTYINGDFNYSDLGEPKDAWFNGVGKSFEGWYTDEAVIDAIIAEGKAPEVVVEITEADKALLQKFADEMVALFNNAEIDDKVETTQDNFQGSTHPNVKGAFGNAEALAKYKWFLEFVVATMKEKAEADGKTGDAWYVETIEMLEKMVGGDAAAISGSYANGRTCFRQFIHKLINAYNANATAGNTSYNPYVVDFANEPAKVKAFLELYKANGDVVIPEVKKYVVKFDNEGVLETVEVVEGEKVNKPADPVKEGYEFLGWFVGEEEYDFDKAVVAELTLVAKWEEAVVLPEEVTVDPAGEIKTIAEGLAAVKAGGKVVVKAGTYEEAVKVEKAVTIVGEGEVVLTQTVELASDNVKLVGIKFTCGTAILANVALNNIAFEACAVEAAALGTADGMFQFNGYVTNLVVKDCTFSMKTNRGIRFEVGGKDVEVTNCAFVGNGYGYDHVRFQGPATGNVKVANCTFEDSLQSFVYAHNMNGAEVNFVIEGNTFTNAANVAVDLRTHNGADAATAKVTYSISKNSFTGVFSWGTIRLRAQGLTEGNVVANINYNVFKGIELTDDPNHATLCDFYVQQAGGTVAFNYINADYNYSDLGAYKASWVQNCSSAEGWFESEEALYDAIAQLEIRDITVVEAVAIGKELAHQENTKELYRFTGVIVNVTNEKYGNVYISDDNFQNQILVYGIDGYSSMESKPVAGDTVVLVGNISNFSGAAQVANAKLVSFEKGVLEVAVDPNGEVKTIAEAIEKVNWGGTVTLAAGTYEEALVIEKAVTILGPNAGKSGLADDRAEEAVINAPIQIKVEGVTIDGVKLEANANIEFAAGKAKVANVYSLASNCIKTDTINRTAVLYATVEVSDIEVVDSYFNIGDASYLKGVWASELTVSNITFEGNYFTHNNTDNSSISDCIAMYRVGGELNFVNNHFVWVTDDWDLFIGYNANYCTVINVIENTFDGVGELYTCGNTIRNLEPTAVVNIIGNTFNTLSGTILSSNGSVAGATINCKYNAYMNCKYKQGTAGSATYVHENNYYALEQVTATDDYGKITSKEELDAAYNASKENSVVFVAAEAGYANDQVFTSYKLGNVTMAGAQGAGTNPPKYYNSGLALRFYANNTLSFTADAGYKITKIEIVTDASNDISNDRCDFANAEVSFDGVNVTLVPTDGTQAVNISNKLTKGNFRVVSLTIYYCGA